MSHKFRLNDSRLTEVAEMEVQFHWFVILCVLWKTWDMSFKQQYKSYAVE